MKKQLTTALLVFAFLLLMAGCSAETARKLDAAEERMEHRMDVIEDTLETAVRQQTAPAAPHRTGPEFRETQPVPAAQNQITREDAEKIALDHVGVTAEQAQRLRANFEMDDGVPQYDVEFLEGDWEYEFEIDANSGRILSYDRDHRYD